MNKLNEDIPTSLCVVVVVTTRIKYVICKITTEFVYHATIENERKLHGFI